MDSVTLGGIVFCCLLGAALIGALLRRYLPEPHLSTESKDAIKLPTAIVATLSAIALGLLTASAKTTFDRAEVQLKTTVAQVVVLDRVMVSYGPQTQEARRLLRDFVVTQLDPLKRGTATSEFGIEAVQNNLRSLVPETAPQRLLQARALEISGKITEAYWLLVESESEEPPLPFVVVLVLWLTLLFGTFGLLAPFNATVACTVLICALCVAGAVFLITDMAHPHLGLIHVSDAPFRAALDYIGRPN